MATSNIRREDKGRHPSFNDQIPAHIADRYNRSNRVQKLCSSFDQYHVYAIIGGRAKPMKHIVLPFAVKSLTGNVELVHILNRHGHGVSYGVLYSQVEEIDTALCLQKLELSDGQAAVPRDIYPGFFMSSAWDNIDRLVETASGEGTSHRVNGIAIRAKIENPELVNSMSSLQKTKKRSISTEPLMLPAYNVEKRAGPPQVCVIEVDTRDAVQLAKNKNLAWLLSRISSPEPQTVSSWTGYNIISRDEVTVVQDSVGYFPTINAPANHMSTINEVLNQSINIMQSLELKTIVCVFDLISVYRHLQTCKLPGWRCMPGSCWTSRLHWLWHGRCLRRSWEAGCTEASQREWDLQKGLQASWWRMECFYKPLWRIAGICVPDVRIHIHHLRCQRTPTPPLLFKTGRGRFQSAAPLQRLLVHAHSSCELSGCNLATLPCKWTSGSRSQGLWMDHRWRWQSLYRMDAWVTGTWSCVAADVMEVYMCLQTSTLCVSGEPAEVHQYVPIAVLYKPDNWRWWSRSWSRVWWFWHRWRKLDWWLHNCHNYVM